MLKMKLCTVLFVFGLSVLFSAAYGLRCFSCGMAESDQCRDKVTCSTFQDRCATTKVQGLFIQKSCMMSAACIMPLTSCCEGDLCNDAPRVGQSVHLLLLLSVGIILLFQ
ncbi:hypothetical protein AAFF_G00023980 [Aldrovandia affinis]|uniref:CD59 glycoprotein-like n=1 Tax=Aldrovandia affinis TaxID=143900 RepID=A0AAD7T5U1_9TELE|nr:hypothetical protein AAFF_G00023980 [Aldrovandia affinis]